MRTLLQLNINERREGKRIEGEKEVFMASVLTPLIAFILFHLDYEYFVKF